LTEKAFDEEGFYRIGDTVSFLNPEKPELGLRFTGRISENFKLANGTWVSIGNMRAAILAATRGVLLDIVVAGENREACGLLCWLNPTEAARISKSPDADSVMGLVFVTGSFPENRIREIVMPRKRKQPTKTPIAGRQPANRPKVCGKF
jgi:long-subunit acyl-CoA synthetase (AMP-forming)